jgi:hypothetical protein
MPEIPVYSVSRIRNVVTANLAAVRTGQSSLAEAEARILSAFDGHAEQVAAMAAIRDAEVTADGEGKVRADAGDTSAKAAAAIAPKAGTQRGRVLAFIVEGGGSTDYEIARDLKMLPNSVRPRRNELIAGAYVVDSGQRRQHRGSQWVVWQATAEGHAWYSRQIGAVA